MRHRGGLGLCSHQRDCSLPAGCGGDAELHLQRAFPPGTPSLWTAGSQLPIRKRGAKLLFPYPVCLFLLRGVNMDLPTVCHHLFPHFSPVKSHASDSVREAGSPFSVKQTKGYYNKPYPRRSVINTVTTSLLLLSRCGQNLHRIDVVAVGWGGHRSRLGYGGILRARGPTISHRTAGSNVQHRADAAGGVQSSRRRRRNRLPGFMASLLGPCAVSCQRRLVTDGAEATRLIPNGIGDSQGPVAVLSSH